MQPHSKSTWDPSFGLVDAPETVAKMLKGLKNVKEISNNKKMKTRPIASKINASSESLVKSKDLLESSLDPLLVESVDEVNPKTTGYRSTKRLSSKIPWLNKKITKTGIKSSRPKRWLARRSHLNRKVATIASTDSESQDDVIVETSCGEATSILKDPKDPFENTFVQSLRIKETSIQLGTINKSLSKDKMKAMKQKFYKGKHKQKVKAINETVVMFDDPNCNVEALTEFIQPLDEEAAKQTILDTPMGQSSCEGEATEAIPELLWNLMYIWLGFEDIAA